MNTDFIRNRMKELGMSAYRLSKESGVSNSEVCYIVSGEHGNPRVMIAKKIADALGVKVDDLLDDS